MEAVKIVFAVLLVVMFVDLAVDSFREHPTCCEEDD